MTMWGTVPDWLTTAATAGALGAAMWAGVTARKLYGIEADRNEVTERERRSTQAQGIAVWSAAEIGDDPDRPESWGLVLQNTSNDVIYSMVVNSARKTWTNNAPVATNNAPAYLTMLPPGTFYLEGDPNGQHPWKLAKDVRYVGHELRPITKSSTIKVLSVTFRDAANRSWSRTDSGELTLVTS